MLHRSRLMISLITVAMILTMAPVALSFSISDIPDNTLRIGNYFFDLSSDNLSNDTILAQALGSGDQKVYFKIGSKWYDVFGASSDADFGDPTKAMADSAVNAWTGSGKYYKAGGVSEDVTLTSGISGTYTITAVTDFSSDFGVSVNGLDSAQYYAVYKSGSIIGSVTAISGQVRSLPAMFSDASVLTVEFYSDSAGSTTVGTATLANGVLTITASGSTSDDFEVISIE